MLKTLIIDDEPDAIQSLRLICNGFCPEVEIVGAAELIEDAEVLIESEKPDVLLLDIDLPRGNAFDLLKRFPKRNFEVVLISALFEKYEKLIKKYKIYECINKPVDIDELATVMKKLAVEKGTKTD